MYYYRLDIQPSQCNVKAHIAITTPYKSHKVGSRIFPSTARSVARSVPTGNEWFCDCSLGVLERILIVLTGGRSHTYKTTKYCQVCQPLSSCLTLLPVESFILGIELNLDQCCIDLLATYLISTFGLAPAILC